MTSIDKLDLEHIERNIYFWVHDSMYTIKIRKQFKDGTFLENKELMDDLFDESRMDEEPCLKKCPRVGQEYQHQFIPLVQK